MMDMNHDFFNYVTVNAELRTLLPNLSDEEYASLRESIETNGYDPNRGGKIVLWDISAASQDKDPEYVVVDGHHRWEIVNHLLEESGETKYFLNNECFTFMDFADIDEVKTWMIENQLKRRNMSPYGRFEVFYRNIDILREQGRKNMSAGGKKGLTTLSNDAGPVRQKHNTREVLAKLCGVSEGTVQKFMDVANSDFDDLKADLRYSRLTAEEAHEILKDRKNENKEEDENQDKEAGGTKKRRSKSENARELEELRKIVAEQRQKIEEQAREIKDLKTMIAEKDQQIQHLKDELAVADELAVEYSRGNDELKQQMRVVDLEKEDAASENLKVPA